jgi:hypothetical protein
VKGDGWFCHKCKRGGDVIDLAAALMRLAPVEAAAELCRSLGLAVPYLPRPERRPRERAAREQEEER